ncbi:MAG: SLC13 family permease [Lachnospiraceae bacterium]
MKKLWDLAKGDVVLCASFVLAVLSCFLTPPGPEYLSYIDFDTLILLFCLMLIMEGLREQKVFLALGNGMLSRVSTRRGVTFTLVFLCFLCSMLITNDVALITFVPFGIMILEMADLHGKLCRTVTLMTIAANLGSMFTPVGNPQNLYLVFPVRHDTAAVPAADASLYRGRSLLLFLLIWFGTGRGSLTVNPQTVQLGDRGTILWYLLLFVCCLLTVAGVLPHILLLILTVAGICWKNPASFVRVDYSLLFTFTFFFIFVGNIRQVEQLQLLIGGLLEGHERLISVAVSQIISNVPAAMLLSGYTDQVRELIVGTNLGGLGTLIASMASLISWKQIASWYPGAKKRYLLEFTGWNLLFLAVLLLIP